METLILITTLKDTSFPLFFTQAVQEKLTIKPILITEDSQTISNVLQNTQYKWVYIRDPFNDKFTISQIKEKLSTIFQSAHPGTIIDGLNSVDDVFFEDKWIQYQSLKQFMPDTQIVTNPADLNFDTQFVKKRLSSRAKGIVFDAQKIKEPQDYIVQSKLDIATEYRINIIGNQIIKQANVKQSKTTTSKVKFVQTVTIDSQLEEFTTQVNQHLNYDFVGLDIARLKSDELILIEVNRSPQFFAVYRDNHINLAEMLVTSLLNS